MRPEIPFIEFPKISRLNREVVITEKIDGTNAQVYITDDGTRAFAGSRTRWITLADDNFGFARWVADHHDELLLLGPGSHFGEWWGAGIQRRYGLSEKRFSLFNVARWSEQRPACCHVVPVLARGNMLDIDATREPLVLAALFALREGGSVAAPGFKEPEGIVVFHTPSRALFKMTLDKNDGAKGG